MKISDKTSNLKKEIYAAEKELQKMQKETIDLSNKIDEAKLKIFSLRNKQIERADVKYLGIPNICFSSTDKDDNREEEYKNQRITRGFDNSELWSLSSSIIGFIKPRLKAFSKQTVGYPSCFKTKKQWDEILNKMIIWTELHEKIVPSKQKEEKEYDEGKKLFFKYFENLWF